MIYKLMWRRQVIQLVHDVTVRFITPLENESCYKGQKLKFMWSLNTLENLASMFDSQLARYSQINLILTDETDMTIISNIRHQ